MGKRPKRPRTPRFTNAQIDARLRIVHMWYADATHPEDLRARNTLIEQLIMLEPIDEEEIEPCPPKQN